MRIAWYGGTVSTMIFTSSKTGHFIAYYPPYPIVNDSTKCVVTAHLGIFHTHKYSEDILWLHLVFHPYPYITYLILSKEGQKWKKHMGSHNVLLQNACSMFFNFRHFQWKFLLKTEEICCLGQQKFIYTPLKDLNIPRKNSFIQNTEHRFINHLNTTLFSML